MYSDSAILPSKKFKLQKLSNERERAPNIFSAALIEDNYIISEVIRIISKKEKKIKKKTTSMKNKIL